MGCRASSLFQRQHLWPFSSPCAVWPLSSARESWLWVPTPVPESDPLQSNPDYHRGDCGMDMERRVGPGHSGNSTFPLHRVSGPSCSPCLAFDHSFKAWGFFQVSGQDLFSSFLQSRQLSEVTYLGPEWETLGAALDTSFCSSGLSFNI